MVEFFLQDIDEDLSRIMIDRYGNYFCQKLLSMCDTKQRSWILELIRKDFTKICCDQRGTHTIQTIFDTLSLPDEEKYIESVLRGKISFLSMDQQGTHVVQKVLQSQILKFDNGVFIFDEI